MVKISYWTINLVRMALIYPMLAFIGLLFIIGLIWEINDKWKNGTKRINRITPAQRVVAASVIRHMQFLVKNRNFDQKS